MSKREPPVRWAPRARPDRIRRLYQLDAQGILDETLIDEVGYALYSRCRSIVHVSDAMLGRVHCAHCDTIIRRQGSGPDELLRCSRCGWGTCWRDYYATYHTQELGAAGAVDIFATFVSDWEAPHTPREKMLLIDQLIHRWHGETRQERPKSGLGRPTGVNQIDGNRTHVLALLDMLSYGAGSTPGTQEIKAAWRGHWEEVKSRQAAGQAKRGIRTDPPDVKHGKP